MYHSNINILIKTWLVSSSKYMYNKCKLAQPAKFAQKLNLETFTRLTMMITPSSTPPPSLYIPWKIYFIEIYLFIDSVDQTCGSSFFTFSHLFKMPWIFDKSCDNVHFFYLNSRDHTSLRRQCICYSLFLNIFYFFQPTTLDGAFLFSGQTFFILDREINNVHFIYRNYNILMKISKIASAESEKYC